MEENKPDFILEESMDEKHAILMGKLYLLKKEKKNITQEEKEKLTQEVEMIQDSNVKTEFNKLLKELGV
ncbi:MAG TPA: hypothetical protein DHW82_00460 [Spirochaetia bacterium]|nr:MAG: hypothetical protein A2Y41_07175 [Spirochaetes bacterium GWB1_36_13]HCL55471.1 hypothetical protein [Spirochaetia bacterium]